MPNLKNTQARAFSFTTAKNNPDGGVPGTDDFVRVLPGDKTTKVSDEMFAKLEEISLFNECVLLGHIEVIGASPKALGPNPKDTEIAALKQRLAEEDKRRAKVQAELEEMRVKLESGAQKTMEEAQAEAQKVLEDARAEAAKILEDASAKKMRGGRR
jgi:hypothetical protein